MGEKKLNVHQDFEDYNSEFGEDEDRLKELEKRKDLAHVPQPSSTVPSAGSSIKIGLPSRSFFHEEHRRSESYKSSYFNLNAYERHKKLINEYYLYYPGAKLPERDKSRDKRDIDIIKENHKFLWTDSDDADTWEKQLAKKYYDKLFKEYCICDLSRFRENKVAMRWRTEKELIDGRGQFSCGEKHCQIKENLKTWEANFTYMEEGVKLNALVKLRLCPECSIKLNFSTPKREVFKKPKDKKKKKSSSSSSSSSSTSSRKRKRDDEIDEPSTKSTDKEDTNQDKEKEPTEDELKSAEDIWKQPLIIADAKSREEEFDEYLDELFL